ncbi:MAG: trigger factor, partial [SAR202 cluster bacterium]|nr:trigger factor [SAR202 cluster bacterium]
MKVSQEEIESRQATVNIEMESQDMDGYLDRAYRRLVQRLRIPGFRKGKAPRQVVERYVGREGLLNEALDFMVPEVTGKAIQQEALEPAGQPSIELIEVEPLKIKAVVPLSPIVEVGSYRELRLESDSTEVTEDQVDEVLQRLRLELAPWEPVERSVQFDDLVTLDLKGESENRVVVDDRELAFIPRKDFAVPMTGFSEELEGMKIGEIKEFKLPFPPDYSDVALQGKECLFTAKVLELKEKNLTPLDDEFAKGVGEGYESLEALKEKFRADLLEENIREKQRQFEERIIDAVVEGTHFEFAPMMVDHEVDHERAFHLLLEPDLSQRKEAPEHVTFPVRGLNIFCSRKVFL